MVNMAQPSLQPHPKERADHSILVVEHSRDPWTWIIPNFSLPAPCEKFGVTHVYIMLPDQLNIRLYLKVFFW